MRRFVQVLLLTINVNSSLCRLKALASFDSFQYLFQPPPLRGTAVIEDGFFNPPILRFDCAVFPFSRTLSSNDLYLQLNHASFQFFYTNFNLGFLFKL